MNYDDFYAVLNRRHSVRIFQDRPVEREKLSRIIVAGLKAPSHNHMREWEFIFLRDPKKRLAVMELGEVFSRTPDKRFLEQTLEKIRDRIQRDVYFHSVPMQEKMILTAPELLLVCFKMSRPLRSCETLFDLNCFASAWAAVENILLAMAAEGLYGVTMVPFKTGRLKQLLKIPDDYEVATFIPIGYPDKEYRIQQIGVSSEDRIHIDEWQNHPNKSVMT
jgi:nitroreductase